MCPCICSHLSIAPFHFVHIFFAQTTTAQRYLDGYDTATATLVLGKGGFHGGQPHMLDGVNADGSAGGPDEFLNSTLNVTNRIDPQSMAQVRIENLLAELDAPEEWYYDQASETLYFAYNSTANASTAPPPPSLKLGAVTLQNLLQIVGDGAGPSGPPTKPVTNISILGVNFRDAGYTFLNPHGAPSGGDWGMQSPQYPEAGAVYLAGTESVVFDSCIFKYLQGNGVYLAGYNRGQWRRTAAATAQECARGQAANMVALC